MKALSPYLYLSTGWPAEGTGCTDERVQGDLAAIASGADLVAHVVLAGLHTGDHGAGIAREVEVNLVVPGGLIAAPAGVVALSAVGGVAVEGLQADVLVGLPLVVEVGAGADILLHKLARADRADDGGGHDGGLLAQSGNHLVEIERTGLQADLHGVVVHGCEARVAHEPAGVGRGVDPAVHGDDHVSGLHFLAVVELHAVTQMIGVNAVFVGELPGFGQLGDHPALTVESHQLFEYGDEHDLGGDVHAAHGHVQVLGLSGQGDVQRLGFGGRRGGGFGSGRFGAGGFGGGGGAPAAAGKKGQTQGQDQRQGKDLFHSCFLLMMGSVCWNSICGRIFRPCGPGSLRQAIRSCRR